tara:strand:+ start:530 stop:679 length:150 start_codon:yes stop_codon:yes gene_type:complete
MIAMIVTNVGFKFPNPINPSSMPQYLIAFLFFEISEVKYPNYYYLLTKI